MRRERPGRARVAGRADSGMRALGWMLIALALSATTLLGQESLTLDEAIRIASRNNPIYLQRENDQGAADWGVRQAYGAFLPSVSARGSVSFREAGVERVGTQAFSAGTTDYHQSFYSLDFAWSLDGDAIYGVPSARARSAATEAGIQAAEFDLRNRVALQYMAVLRARDVERVARETFRRNRQNLEIVQGRVDAGFAAGTERTQAEVEVGRAEVALLRAEQRTRTEKARLMEQLGVVMPEGFELVDTFQLFEPTWTMDELVMHAMRRHPSLRSFAASESASKAAVRQAQSAYLPSLRLSTSLNGFAQRALNEDFVVSQTRDGFAGAFNSCQRSNALAQTVPGGGDLWQVRDCSAFVFTDEIGQQALAANTLDFDKNPIQLNLSLSVPVFSGFSRQRQVEQADQMARDAELDLRAEELRLRTAITESYEQLAASWRAVEIERRNRELATVQLEQARQRYQVGNTSILELRDAEESLQTAERDYLDATYSFHQWRVALEAATGRELQPEGAESPSEADGTEG